MSDATNSTVLSDTLRMISTTPTQSALIAGIEDLRSEHHQDRQRQSGEQDRVSGSPPHSWVPTGSGPNTPPSCRISTRAIAATQAPSKPYDQNRLNVEITARRCIDTIDHSARHGHCRSTCSDQPAPSGPHWSGDCADQSFPISRSNERRVPL